MQGQELAVGAARPVGNGDANSPLAVYSLLIATFLGTMGLPHILVRFYTNQNGTMARRTTVRVLGLLALFYAFPAVYGALGRALVPQLYTTGGTDAVVLELPQAAWPGLGGELLGALVAAGAFAAFLSTASGLMVSLAGTLSSDLSGRRRAASRRFRVAALAGVVPPMLLALAARDLDITVLVGWAFALAASTFCPLLLLGIWWSRLTARGAAAGLASGALLAQPAAISVPLAFATMGLLSLRARPADVGATMAALHVPERAAV